MSRTALRLFPNEALEVWDPKNPPVRRGRTMRAGVFFDTGSDYGTLYLPTGTAVWCRRMQAEPLLREAGFAGPVEVWPMKENEHGK